LATPAPVPGLLSRGIPRLLRRVCASATEALGALVFPWECPVCGGEVAGAGGPFCPGCRADLLGGAGDACRRCAMPVGPWGILKEGCGECRDRSLGFDAAVALGLYQGALRALCLRLKHQPDAWIAPWLAGLLLDARPVLREEAARSDNALVVPVPLHWRRRWSRGYNQSEALARGLAERLGLRQAAPLRRVKSTRILAGLRRDERARTLRDAFRARPVVGMWAGAGAGLKGRTVFLVDDILTTGATCGAAARVLKRAGAARVVAVVIARAEGRS
jgi:ComF family protein